MHASPPGSKHTIARCGGSPSLATRPRLPHTGFYSTGMIQVPPPQRRPVLSSRGACQSTLSTKMRFRIHSTHTLPKRRHPRHCKIDSSCTLSSSCVQNGHPSSHAFSRFISASPNPSMRISVASSFSKKKELNRLCESRISPKPGPVWKDRPLPLPAPHLSVHGLQPSHTGWLVHCRSERRAFHPHRCLYPLRAPVGSSRQHRKWVKRVHRPAARRRTHSH